MARSLQNSALALALIGIGVGLPVALGALAPPAASGPALALLPGTAPAPPFGRHGPLTQDERAVAETAWSYFVAAYQPETGLVNAVGDYPSTTMWDTASYLSALVSAHDLGLIDRAEFDRRATKLLATLHGLRLSQGKLPNKAYNTKTAERVDYANTPGDLGYSALDLGRLLIWLKIVKERYPHLGNQVDAVVLRWNFCDVISAEGQLFGATVGKDGKTKSFQEGRLGYEEYSAKGFALWGFDTTEASKAEPYQIIPIEGVDVPADGRDPRLFHSQNYVVSEGYILEGLELNWDLPNDRSNQPGLASDGWRADFADRIYQVQERRFQHSGILTARSEHQVEGAPYFVYDAIFADGYAWNTLDPAQGYAPDRAAVSSKAAIGMWALWETTYTQLLFDHVAHQGTAGKGLDEGVYEDGSGPIPLQTANNNGIILAALLYKVQGPILQYRNDQPQIWDLAGAGTGQRKARCQPEPKARVQAAPLPPAPCPEAGSDPALAATAYCRPPRAPRRRLFRK
ncbi:DUF3131 domain-containing protein [Xinfangfangia pollutisoli]|uniref:DUF3131 domain-containing protein n=1 Tax=Xinfangfangia pollutisoli TaxID=2865960 RepID=UPI001CD3AB97|nr:DUF3131 domain-containing protein [Xinfangfangia pollutisoli]